MYCSGIELALLKGRLAEGFCLLNINYDTSLMYCGAIHGVCDSYPSELRSAVQSSSSGLWYRPPLEKGCCCSWEVKGIACDVMCLPDTKHRLWACLCVGVHAVKSGHLLLSHDGGTLSACAERVAEQCLHLLWYLSFLFQHCLHGMYITRAHSLSVCVCV